MLYTLSIRRKQKLPNFPDTDSSLFFFGRVSVAWLAHDWSKTGIYGDPTLGTAEKGEALIAEGVRRLTKWLTVMSRFEVPNQEEDWILYAGLV